jgi:hypothetical protein
MSSPDRPLRIITEADLPEIAKDAAQYFGGLDLRKMMEIALRESAIDVEYRIVEDSDQSQSNNPIAQIPENLSPEVTNG